MSEEAERVNLKARYSRRLKLLVVPVACLYLLISALLTLCLVHPHGHSHSDADGHFHFVCVWVQKAVSSHAPSARVILPVAETSLSVLLSLSWIFPPIRVVQLPGRSPPNLPFFA
jgi:hypothetical protein